MRWTTRVVIAVVLTTMLTLMVLDVIWSWIDIIFGGH